MGYGVPAGFGAAVSTAERPLILVGDGAFQMTGFELGNCRRYGWGPIVIVFNNTSWEMLLVFQPQSRFNDLGRLGIRAARRRTGRARRARNHTRGAGGGTGGSACQPRTLSAYRSDAARRRGSLPLRRSIRMVCSPERRGRFHCQRTPPSMPLGHRDA